MIHVVPIALIMFLFFAVPVYTLVSNTRPVASLGPKLRWPLLMILGAFLFVVKEFTF